MSAPHESPAIPSPRLRGEGEGEGRLKPRGPMAPVKGWCPGALRPMLSGDGLIARIRISCGEVPLALARDIADWAETYGNGALDLSGRGNLQIRGVSDATLPRLTQRLAEAGLLDASPEAEAVRNVLVSPFAGLDPSAPCDVRPHARAWERELSTASQTLGAACQVRRRLRRRRLSARRRDGPRFHGRRAGRFRPAPRRSGRGRAFPRRASRRRGERRWRARFSPCAETSAPPKRMRDAIAAHGLAPFAPAAVSAQAAPRAHWLGAHALGSSAFVGLALPFGRIAAPDLRELAGLAALAGATSLRLTPWRALIVPGLALPAARRLAESARRLGLIVDPDDPLLAVAACPGLPACSSAKGETRAAARRLAPLLAATEGVALHVSGCAKGCACPTPAPFARRGDGRRLRPHQERPRRFRAARARPRAGGARRPAQDERDRLMAPDDYIRDGDEIYRRSFAIIRAEADLARFEATEERVAVRIVHACGMPDVARDLVFAPGAAEAARRRAESRRADLLRRADGGLRRYPRAPARRQRRRLHAGRSRRRRSRQATRHDALGGGGRSLGRASRWRGRRHRQRADDALSPAGACWRPARQGPPASSACRSASSARRNRRTR